MCPGVHIDDEGKNAIFPFLPTYLILLECLTQTHTHACIIMYDPLSLLIETGTTKQNKKKPELLLCVCVYNVEPRP